MEILKTIFVDYNFTGEEMELYDTYYTCVADGVYFVEQVDVQLMEDNLYTGETLTEEELNPYIKRHEVEKFKEIVTGEGYDALLNGDIDLITILPE